MKQTTYRALLTASGTLCIVNMAAFASSIESNPNPSLSTALLGVGLSDWLAVAIVSLSFGLVSLLQRFKRSEAGEKYAIFVAAHMGGSLISGVMLFLLTQSLLSSPNRFAQALAIGAAGWTGSTLADWLTTRINKNLEKVIP